jgi:hypothetical protein
MTTPIVIETVRNGNSLGGQRPAAEADPGGGGRR